jgi:S-formylglutathione hydrolase
MHAVWSTLNIAGKAVDVFHPPGIRVPRFAVLHLHGAGLETLSGNAVFTRFLEELGLPCVCPHGGLCWWTDRLCDAFDAHVSAERFLLEQMIPFFQERWGLAPPAIGLQGISMGGQGALRLAFKHSKLFPVVAAIAPALDYHELYGQGTAIDAMYDSKEQCRQDTALMHVPPTDYPPHIFFCVDPDDARWYRGNDRLNEKLRALGIPHESDLTTRAGGHSWDYFNHMAERTETFVLAGLEHESRRLL